MSKAANQLVVKYLDGQTRYYPIDGKGGWSKDLFGCCLMIGRGVPRTMIPLRNIAAYTVTHVEPAEGVSDRQDDSDPTGQCSFCGYVIQLIGGTWRHERQPENHEATPSADDEPEQCGRPHIAVPPPSDEPLIGGLTQAERDLLAQKGIQ